jgi:hypothetical protein
MATSSIERAGKRSCPDLHPGPISIQQNRLRRPIRTGRMTGESSRSGLLIGTYGLSDRFGRGREEWTAKGQR